MESSTKLKICRYVCIGLAAALVLVTLIFGFRQRSQRIKFDKERIELQDKNLSLEKELLKKDQDLVAAEQEAFQAKTEYNEKVGSLQTELDKVKWKHKLVLKELKSYGAPELEEFFAERYEGCADTAGDTSRFVMTVDVGNHVVYDLIDGDFYREESERKDSILVVQKDYIADLDTAVVFLTADRNTYRNKAELFEEMYKESDNNVDYLKKSLKSQRTTSIICGSVAGAAVIGLVISLIIGGR